MANYIGKIAAVVTANVSDVAPKLSASAREWNKYGKSVQASIDAARRNARSSFDQIFTAQQRLERAFAASRNTTLRISTREGEDAIRRLIGASEELARPLVSAQKQFSSLSSSIQNEFGRALSEAQNAARSAAAAINETGRLGSSRSSGISDESTRPLFRSVDFPRPTLPSAALPPAVNSVSSRPASLPNSKEHPPSSRRHRHSRRTPGLLVPSLNLSNFSAVRPRRRRGSWRSLRTSATHVEAMPPRRRQTLTLRRRGSRRQTRNLSGRWLSMESWHSAEGRPPRRRQQQQDDFLLRN